MSITTIKTGQFYIGGRWVDPTASASLIPVINPATEQSVAQLAMGTAHDVDLAVSAARIAFDSFSQTSVGERVEMLNRLAEVYKARAEAMAEAISTEMGAPMLLATSAQVPAGRAHIKAVVRALESLAFEYEENGGTILREPVGVCAMITPWNWPMNQITLKVAPALAAGCTMVLKPSEIAPLSGLLFAEIIDEAGIPAGVFNLVSGDGPTVGAALAAHPDVDMVTFTGSTRAGTAVAKGAADTVKRVAQELGGKSPNIILDDAELERAVKVGVLHCMNNTGQSCNAPTRMLVHRDQYEQAVAIAKSVAEKIEVGDPAKEGRHIGPLVSEAQFQKVQSLIETGINEGARLVIGGPGKPEGIDSGYFVKPTVFADVSNDMTIAREEVFGPVLCMIPYADDDEAIAIANDTPYGLAAYLSTSSNERARAVARRLRAGMVHINGAMQASGQPFGGYKQSGNGREGGSFGIEDFLEVKSVSGFEAA